MEEIEGRSKARTKKRTSRKSKHPGPAGYPDPNQVHHHYYYEPIKVRRKRSSKPGYAGGLLIVSAVLGLLFSMAMIAGSVFMGDVEGGMEFWSEDNTGDITGTVRYQNGTPAEGVTISLVGEDLSTQTDSNGNYILYNAPLGKQELKVEQEGYNTIIYKMFISPGEANWRFGDDRNHWDSENNQNFTLTPGDQTLERGSYPPFGMIGSFILICGVVVLIFSIIALMGGIWSLKRKKFTGALIGSIFGIFTLVGALFSIIALFMLIFSKKEFNGDSDDEGDKGR